MGTLGENLIARLYEWCVVGVTRLESPSFRWPPPCTMPTVPPMCANTMAFPEVASFFSATPRCTGQSLGLYTVHRLSVRDGNSRVGWYESASFYIVLNSTSTPSLPVVRAENAFRYDNTSL